MTVTGVTHVGNLNPHLLAHFALQRLLGGLTASDKASQSAVHRLRKIGIARQQQLIARVTNTITQGAIRGKLWLGRGSQRIASFLDVHSHRIAAATAILVIALPVNSLRLARPGQTAVHLPARI